MADNNFIMEQLINIVKDLSSLNNDVDKSFKTFQASLVNIEKTVGDIKNKSHLQEHQISTIYNDLKNLRCNYDSVKIETEKRIVVIEGKLKGYIHKPNMRRTITIVSIIATTIAAITTIIINWDKVSMVLNKIFH